jgi:hypothetical protein
MAHTSPHGLLYRIQAACGAHLTTCVSVMLFKKLMGVSLTMGSGDMSGRSPSGSTVDLNGLGLGALGLPNGEADGAEPKGLLAGPALPNGFGVSVRQRRAHHRNSMRLSVIGGNGVGGNGIWAGLSRQKVALNTAWVLYPRYSLAEIVGPWLELGSVTSSPSSTLYFSRISPSALPKNSFRSRLMSRRTWAAFSCSAPQILPTAVVTIVII